MTSVSFHVNVSDKPAYVCRLVRKAYRSGAHVVLVGSPGQLRQMDELLWTFSGPDFVPHYGPDEDGRTARPSQGRVAPVRLSSQQPVKRSAHGPEILINLGTHAPQGHEQFERVFEIVGIEESEVLAGRARWKAYKAAGHEPVKHDFNDLVQAEPPRDAADMGSMQSPVGAGMNGEHSP